jgi:hypothetical protein
MNFSGITVNNREKDRFWIGFRRLILADRPFILLILTRERLIPYDFDRRTAECLMKTGTKSGFRDGFRDSDVRRVARLFENLKRRGAQNE